MYNSCHTRPQNAVYQHDQPSVQHATVTKHTNTQTLTSISSLLDRADQVYKLLVQHRNELDQLLTSLASGTVLVSQRGVLTGGDSSVNKGIQLVAHRYCMDCKTTYHELSKIIQVCGEREGW